LYSVGEIHPSIVKSPVVGITAFEVKACCELLPVELRKYEAGVVTEAAVDKSESV
jgi:hypothetical protein